MSFRSLALTWVSTFVSTFRNTHPPFFTHPYYSLNTHWLNLHSSCWAFTCAISSKIFFPNTCGRSYREATPLSVAFHGSFQSPIRVSLSYTVTYLSVCLYFLPIRVSIIFFVSLECRAMLKVNIGGMIFTTWIRRDFLER